MFECVCTCGTRSVCLFVSLHVPSSYSADMRSFSRLVCFLLSIFLLLGVGP